ncbi:MAG: chemotaxis response regulator protein-glutamate methylesterase [Candidatus Hydrogenedentes bacterium]|nr:chemotaxis response regulator protein-glutamate methylesterase [Candidatus Hydrogenedentota bacterium]
MGNEDVRILVLDDSVESRRALSDVVAAMPRTVLEGASAPSDAAFSRMRLGSVDIVLVPAQSGLDTIRKIRARSLQVGVILISDAEENQARLTLDALDEGALGFVKRSAGWKPGDGHADLVRQIFPLICAYQARRSVKLIRESAAAAPTSRLTPGHSDDLASRLRNPINLVAVGISTGGPETLSTLFRGMPETLGVPMLVVQHMPPVFTRTLAGRLNQISSLDVREAAQGDTVTSDSVLIAPGGRHMTVVREYGLGATTGPLAIRLTDTPPVHACRPSVDVLFQSLADQAVRGVLAVVMTGMGSDGCSGVRALKKHGAYCITQDEESCVVYGMPRAVDEAGLSDERVQLPHLASRIARLVKQTRPFRS